MRMFIIHEIEMVNRAGNPIAIQAETFAEAIREWLAYNAPLKYTESYIRKVEVFDFPLPPTPQGPG